MADRPGLLIADTYFLGAGVVAAGSGNGHGEYLNTIAGGNEGTVAVGLLGERFLQFNSDAVVVGQACNVVDRWQIGCWE